MRLAALPAAVALLASSALAEEPAHAWDYSALHGPDHWAELSDAFSACGEGHNQSPINIHSRETIAPGAAPAIEINWKPFRPRVIDNGHSIEADAHHDAGGVTLHGETYELLQFHFHHLSEHAIDGRRTPMEAHFVHRGPRGDLLVLGAMIVEGEPNPTLQAILEAAEGAPTHGVDPRALIPAFTEGYRYSGSLTTPPCSENVTWHVFAAPVTASAGQIAAFAALYPDNARPPRSDRGRLVVRSH